MSCPAFNSKFKIQNSKFFFFFFFFFLAILSLTIVAVAEESTQSNYRIGPKDLIAIKVFEIPDLNVEVRVEGDGIVRLPMLGELRVEGLTAAQVAENIQKVLEERYVQHASVTVDIREYRSRPISVIGAVRKPGPLNISGRWTLLEALAAAGGLTDEHGDMIYVMRRSSNGLSDQVAISVDDLMVRAKLDVNIPVFAGDLINVPATVEISLICLGEVKKPGAVTFKSTERITLMAAIARAGGLTDRASKMIVIRRHDRGNKDMEIKADFKKIRSGKEPDIELERDDVVVVKESFF